MVRSFDIKNMQTIDIIIAILLAVGFVSGLRDGLVKQIAGLAGLIAGLIIGKSIYVPVGDWLTHTFSLPVQTAYIAAFVLILVIVPLFFSLIGWIISRILKAICLGTINRILGGIVGILKYTLFVGILITGIEFFDKNDNLIPESTKKASILYYPIYDASGIFFNSIKEQIGTISHNEFIPQKMTI